MSISPLVMLLQFRIFIVLDISYLPICYSFLLSMSFMISFSLTPENFAYSSMFVIIVLTLVYSPAPTTTTVFALTVLYVSFPSLTSGT